MLDHFSGDNYVESFIQIYLVKAFEVDMKYVSDAVGSENLDSFLIIIKSVEMGCNFFQIEMKQRACFYRDRCIWMIGAPEMKNFLAGANLFGNWQALNQL